MIDLENQTTGRVFITRKIEGSWYRPLALEVLNKVQGEDLTPDTIRILLGDLLHINLPEARDLAASILHLPLPRKRRTLARALAVAVALMAHAEDAGWSIVWPVIRRNPSFGKNLVFALVQSTPRGRSVGERLSESQLAELFRWLARAFPHSEDPSGHGVRALSPRDHVAQWRDQILRTLEARGTPESLFAIRELMESLPHLEWLKWTLLNSQEVVRRHTWLPPVPAAILALASNAQGRLVQSGDQLLSVVLESLKRLEGDLQGDTPAAIDLWNGPNSRGRYTPKDELSFVEYVKRHLDKDLRSSSIVVNREVEIRRPRGGKPGERTDIKVDAIARDAHGKPSDIITAIVEAKGCWNEDLDQAMKTQLVDRYLRDNRARHGLYLVGSFQCTQWDDNDYRKARTRTITRTELQRRFDDQARDLSTDDMRIRASVINVALR